MIRVLFLKFPGGVDRIELWNGVSLGDSSSSLHDDLLLVERQSGNMSMNSLRCLHVFAYDRR